MLECLSISKPARSVGKDRELTDAEKDALVIALFTRRGVDNQHSKALYLKVRLESKTVSKVLVDNGTTSNIVPITILQLIGKTEDDITPGKVTVVGFAGTPEFCEGTIMLTVKVGSCTLTMPFYVVRGRTSYNALLGRSWLYRTYSIPSSLHQILVMWNGRRYEIIYADVPSVEINFSVVHERCSKGSATLRIEESDMPRGGDTNKESKSLLEDLKIEELIEVEDLEVEESTPRTREDAVELSLLPFRLQDPLEQVNLGSKEDPRFTFISAKMSDDEKSQMVELLVQYKDCFAWEHHEMPGIDPSIARHKLLIKKGWKPVVQRPRRMSPEVIKAVREEVE
ncbi:hypothetical protein RND81_02G177200 [Saponaria officinalis]|uniref:Uncharacterized protein n=1 Tax=Saponaria officinalis TaxID=3572 RepID=A0AAW1MMC2_SAPOF